MRPPTMSSSDDARAPRGVSGPRPLISWVARCAGVRTSRISTSSSSSASQMSAATSYGVSTRAASRAFTVRVQRACMHVARVHTYGRHK